LPSFDDLAEQLANAPDAADRVSAAERLAQMDDPRAVPALARALGDPDGRVRRRVEELLSQFSRGDSTGKLQALLQEAERVADELSREVDRLRGRVPPEALETAVEPVEPPEGFEGDCALALLVPRAEERKRLATIVSRVLGKARFLVTRELQTTKGFLAREVPAAQARTAVRELWEADIPAAAVPTEQVPPPLTAVRLRQPRFDGDALRGTAVPGGETVAVAWDTVELALAARLEVELKREAKDEDWSVWTRPLAAGEASPHEQSHEYLVEVFAGEPLQRYRLATHELDFDAMQRRPASFGRVARLARRLVRRLDRRRINAGLRRLEEGDDEDWDRLTFVSPPGFESYVSWLRLLLRLGVPLPR
jgi:hypothetical protein